MPSTELVLPNKENGGFPTLIVEGASHKITTKDDGISLILELFHKGWIDGKDSLEKLVAIQKLDIADDDGNAS